MQCCFTWLVLPSFLHQQFSKKKKAFLSCCQLPYRFNSAKLLALCKSQQLKELSLWYKLVGNDYRKSWFCFLLWSFIHMVILIWIWVIKLFSSVQKLKLRFASKDELLFWLFGFICAGPPYSLKSSKGLVVCSRMTKGRLTRKVGVGGLERVISQSSSNPLKSMRKPSKPKPSKPKQIEIALIQKSSTSPSIWRWLNK